MAGLYRAVPIPVAPSLILAGEPWQIVWALLTAVIGIYMVTAGIVGLLRRPIGIAFRGVLVVGGVLAIMPAGLFAGGIWSDIAGRAVFGVVLFMPASAVARRKPGPNHGRVLLSERE